MLISQERIDQWLIKGFDGASRLMVDRTDGDRPEHSSVELLKLTIENLEGALNNKNHIPIGMDNFFFEAIYTFSRIVYSRSKEKAIGPAQKLELQSYLERLKLALARIK